jgi:hypothetical protein
MVVGLNFDANFSFVEKLQFAGGRLRIPIFRAFLTQPELQIGYLSLNISAYCLMQGGKEVCSPHLEDGRIGKSNAKRRNAAALVAGDSSFIAVSYQPGEFSLREAAFFTVSSKITDEWFVCH